MSSDCAIFVTRSLPVSFPVAVKVSATNVAARYDDKPPRLIDLIWLMRKF